MRRFSMIFLIFVAVFLWQLPATYAQISDQGGVPIYGLVGTLRPVTGRPTQTELVTAAGIYRIVGATAAVDAEIQQLRNQQPVAEVKVWGELRSAFSLPDAARLVADEVVRVADRSVEANTRKVVLAVVDRRVATIYAQPNVGATVIAQVNARTALEILGRDPGNLWWHVCCVNGRTGWVAQSAVTVADSIAYLPIVSTDRPAVITTPTPGGLSPATPPPPLFTPDLPTQDWWATFYNNITLSDPPVLGTRVNAVDFNWGQNAPFARVAADQFSARFERTLTLQPGFYEFTVQADDGVRVWVDGERVVDEWHLAGPPQYQFGRNITAPIAVRIDYFDAGGAAKIRFQYRLVANFPEWRASYYDNIDLSGGPSWVEAAPRGADRALGNYWSLGSPVPGVIPNDNWSARYEGRYEFGGGNYLFWARADDGVRLWLDNILVLDGWRGTAGYIENTFYSVGPGAHSVRIEYYERGGLAQIEVDWYRLGD